MNATDPVLVTGANGRIGRRLIERLEAHCAPVAAVRSERARAMLPQHAAARLVDYGDAESLARAAEGCGAAVHLVGIVKESAANRYADAHEGAARALAEAASRTGLQRIAALSITGADTASPNPCFASRGRAERILLESPTPATILRVPMVLGEGDPASRALRRRAASRIALVLRAASREQPIYAGDVVEALGAALAPEAPVDCVLELAGPESLTRAALLRRAGAVLDNRPRVISLPLALGLTAAGLLERLLDDPPLTRAMLEVLDHDDEVHIAETCRALEVTPLGLDETLARVLPRENLPL